MKILIVEPFLKGSHKAWAEGYQQHSQHDVDILSMQGRHWKWRMHGGAVTLAERFNASIEKTGKKPDLILATDMLDLTSFMALTKKHSHDIPTAIYFHENQITYPWSPTDADVKLERNNHYGFINYTSALAADRIFFNSDYHNQSFNNSIDPFLSQFPDHKAHTFSHHILKKSETLSLGMSLKKFNNFDTIATDDVPILLWNHRWEYDKNPEGFYQILKRLKQATIDFKLVILGESFKKKPPIFNQIISEFRNEILHVGFVSNFAQYAYWLWKADILPVTSNQDFFGGSVVEAIYCNCYPILPDRLAYPQHIPEKYHDDHLYKNEDELFDKIREASQNLKAIRKMEEFQQFVAHYDWEELAGVYDVEFSEMSAYFNT